MDKVLLKNISRLVQMPQLLKPGKLIGRLCQFDTSEEVSLPKNKKEGAEYCFWGTIVGVAIFYNKAEPSRLSISFPPHLMDGGLPFSSREPSYLSLGWAIDRDEKGETIVKGYTWKLHFESGKALPGILTLL